MWTATIAAGLLQALALRFSISGDGNSYLDVASAYLRGDFANAINAYWSPFYSWLIALVLWVFKPSACWETTILHLLDFAGLLVALRSFEFFSATSSRPSKTSRGRKVRACNCLSPPGGC